MTLCAPPAAAEDGGSPAGEPAIEAREPPAKGLESIKAADARKHLFTLASKKMQGRGSGLPGCDMAGEYLIERVKEYGLEPAGGTDITAS